MLCLQLFLNLQVALSHTNIYDDSIIIYRELLSNLLGWIVCKGKFDKKTNTVYAKVKKSIPVNATDGYHFPFGAYAVFIKYNYS